MTVTVTYTVEDEDGDPASADVTITVYEMPSLGTVNDVSDEASEPYTNSTCLTVKGGRGALRIYTLTPRPPATSPSTILPSIAYHRQVHPTQLEEDVTNVTLHRNRRLTATRPASISQISVQLTDSSNHGEEVFRLHDHDHHQQQ